MEYYIITPNKALSRELNEFFHGNSCNNGINVVLFIQDAGVNLFEREDNLAKDSCLDKFFAIAQALDEKLEGYWRDYLDPTSGLPMKSTGSNAMSDVEIWSRLLKVEYYSFSGCFIALHPIYKNRAYPSTFFTDAPTDLIRQALQSII